MKLSVRQWFAREVLVLEPMLRRYLRRLAPRAENADLLHETYARALALPAAEVERIQATKPFIFAMARNVALDWLRRQKIVRIQGMTEIEARNVIDQAVPLDEALDSRRELDRLIKVVASMPERCREVFTLRKVYGLSQKEIAARLGISEHTVEKHVAHGVKLCTERFFAAGTAASDTDAFHLPGEKDGSADS